MMPLPNESASVVVNATAFPHLSTTEKWVVCPVGGASSSATDASAGEAPETEQGLPGTAPASGMRVPASAHCVDRDVRVLEVGHRHLTVPADDLLRRLRGETMLGIDDRLRDRAVVERVDAVVGNQLERLCQVGLDEFVAKLETAVRRDRLRLQE